MPRCAQPRIMSARATSILRGLWQLEPLPCAKHDQSVGVYWYPQISNEPKRWNADLVAYRPGVKYSTMRPPAIPSGVAFRSGQLRRIEAEFFASLQYQTRIQNLPRAAKRDLGFTAFAMYRHHRPALVPLVMLTVIDAAPLFHQPFSECRAFHISTSRCVACFSSAKALTDFRQE